MGPHAASGWFTTRLASGALVALALGTASHGQSARAEPVSGAAAVALPTPCQPSQASSAACVPDSTFELALETEYWARVERTDLPGMIDWLARAAAYFNASRTPRAGRLATLITAGHLMVYRSRDLLDPKGLPTLLEALAWAERAHALAPNSPNTASFYYFLRAYRQFGLLDRAGGMAAVDALLALPQRFGHLGSEGEVVGALALGLLTEVGQARRAIGMLRDCTTPNCLRTSSLAPFKVIGMQLALAETYAKVGDRAGMEDRLDEARELARGLSWPFTARIDALEAELTRNGGLVDLWRDTERRIGLIQLPLPPSAAASACSTCHVGARVPKGMYP